MLSALAAVFVRSEAQTVPENTLSQNSRYQCRDSGSYTLNPVIVGAFGTKQKTWYQKTLPFLFKYNSLPDIPTTDFERIYARPLAVGESKRSQQIRTDARQKLLELQQSAEQNWQTWLKSNPNADSEDQKTAETKIHFQGLAQEKLSQFDWSKNGVDVGTVGFQGFGCNTCWAFASLDAMQISRQIAALRRPDLTIDQNLTPKVQQLISCFVPKKADFCNFNWHGEAFSFMVDKGLPLGGTGEYDAANNQKWTCRPDKYVKALTWDFVSRDPKYVSETEDIKRALILYGPIVSMIKYNDCFFRYGGGVFDEEDNRDGTHLVLIIGWDDEKGAWRIKNSFGEQWGEKGFGWVKYGSNNIGEGSAWIMADPKEELITTGKN
ncbi:MAG: C1 family peptidase [Pyrinomonadaceae bacterium]